MGGPACDIPSEHQHISRASRQYTCDHIEQGGLAGAVWPDDGFAVAGHHLDRDIAHGLQASKAFAQPAQFERGLNTCERLMVHAMTPHEGPLWSPAPRQSYSQNLQGG